MLDEGTVVIEEVGFVVGITLNDRNAARGIAMRFEPVVHHALVAMETLSPPSKLLAGKEHVIDERAGQAMPQLNQKHAIVDVPVSQERPSTGDEEFLQRS